MLRRALYVSEVITDPIRRWRYERRRELDVSVLDGHHRLSEKIAVYVLWQPDEILKSSYETLKFLFEKDFSVIVVSNTRLDSRDRDQFLKLCALLIERPNWGYDFGAYQEGILTAFRRAINISELLLLNDSVWFPIFPDTNLIESLRSSESDIVGPIFYRHPSDPEKDYLQSYMLFIKKEVLQSRAFRVFWESYKAASNKEKTVRRGERGFSQNMSIAGFQMGSIYSFEDVLKTANGIDENDFARILDHELKINQKIRKFIYSRHGSQDVRIADLETAITDLLSCSYWSRYLLKTHPRLTNFGFGMPFIKKDRSLPYRLVRREFVRLQRSSSRVISDCLLAEVKKCI